MSHNCTENYLDIIESNEQMHIIDFSRNLKINLIILLLFCFVFFSSLDNPKFRNRDGFNSPNSLQLSKFNWVFFSSKGRYVTLSGNSSHFDCGRLHLNMLVGFSSGAFLNCLLPSTSQRETIFRIHQECFQPVLIIANT